MLCAQTHTDQMYDTEIASQVPIIQWKVRKTSDLMKYNYREGCPVETGWKTESNWSRYHRKKTYVLQIQWAQHMFMTLTWQNEFYISTLIQCLKIPFWTLPQNHLLLHSGVCVEGWVAPWQVSNNMLVVKSIQGTMWTLGTLSFSSSLHHTSWKECHSP